MRKIELKSEEGTDQGYKEFCLYALSSQNYNGPTLLKMLDVRDKLKEAKNGEFISLEENEWQFLKETINKAQWQGQFADLIAPFIRDFENPDKE